MPHNSNFSVVCFTAKSVFVVCWIAIFLYPAFWHASSPDSLFRRYRLWEKLSKSVNDKVCPFVDLWHMFAYPVHNAALKGKTDRIARLKPDAAAINRVDSFSMTPLAYTAYTNDIDTMNLCLQNGADLNIGNAGSQTALLIAIDHKNEKAAMNLIINGAKSDIPDSAGITPLHLCIKKNMNAIFNQAMQTNPLLDLKDAKGLTPLDYAIKRNSLNTVIALAIAGASPEFSLRTQNIQIGIFLALWQNTKNPHVAAANLAEECARHISNNPLPAEFPIEPKILKLQNDRGQ
ncbi:MAG: ankyrin repeat domain-containing protein [Erysipelotrichia bacterium]|nr:ankyrin repeat domain-containing protein [Erysipelotrichia bacterium]